MKPSRALLVVLVLGACVQVGLLVWTREPALPAAATVQPSGTPGLPKVAHIEPVQAAEAKDAPRALGDSWQVIESGNLRIPVPKLPTELPPSAAPPPSVEVDDEARTAALARAKAPIEAQPREAQIVYHERHVESLNHQLALLRQSLASGQAVLPAGDEAEQYGAVLAALEERIRSTAAQLAQAQLALAGVKP